MTIRLNSAAGAQRGIQIKHRVSYIEIWTLWLNIDEVLDSEESIISFPLLRNRKLSRNKKTP